MRTALLILAMTMPFADVAFSADASGDIDPYWILLHEPAVAEELKLTAEQRSAYEALLDRLDARFFPLRNKKLEEGQKALAEIIAEADRELAKTLEPPQLARLGELHLRRLGTEMLARDDVAAQIGLSEKQRTSLARIFDKTREAIAELQKKSENGTSPKDLEGRIIALKESEQRSAIKLMRAEQKQAWKKIVGPDFDVARLGRASYKAPELVDSTIWFNSQPLTLKEMSGKVVVLHFYASGCINCIRNYPWYRQWHADFADRGVVIVGIHTPETEAERDVSTVRQRVIDEKLTFPILVDAEQQNWNAWGNAMWPSVYVIDKRGRLRDFWAGELNWQGAPGEPRLRAAIEKLLDEPDPK